MSAQVRKLKSLDSNQTSRCPTTESGKRSLISDFLRKSRIEAGLTQIEVANYLDVSIHQIHEYESGLRNIPLIDIYALSNCLNVDPDTILNLFSKTSANELS